MPCSVGGKYEEEGEHGEEKEEEEEEEEEKEEEEEDTAREGGVTDASTELKEEVIDSTMRERLRLCSWSTRRRSLSIMVKVGLDKSAAASGVRLVLVVLEAVALPPLL